MGAGRHIGMAMLLSHSLVMSAQINSPPVLLRGVLLERDPQTASGEFSVRDAENQVFRFLFDARTYVERDQGAIDVSRLRLGEKVEVVSDVSPGSQLRYALTIHVLPVSGPPRPVAQGRSRGRRISADRLELADLPTPYGAVGFAGLVLRCTGDQLVLHTREAGDKTILLRPDTRYIENGGAAESSQLLPNMRVFVRAGRTLSNEMEAYQVIWGGILQPR